ncbi:MAG: type I pullulanase [Cyclobacteriaceae bacterium]|nr:type I pullulanase [Cyclobacteriaceae bacterium]
MKSVRQFILLVAILTVASCRPSETKYATYEDYPAYPGGDLGLTYTPQASTFRLWSPVATSVTLHLYEKGEVGEPITSEPLERNEEGVWAVTIDRDLKGSFYTFQVEVEGKKLEETPGIYAKAVGVNGRRAAVVDMTQTNPEGWENDQRPSLASVSDAIIYEMHVRDFTIHPSSGSKYPGKYLGLSEAGTRSPSGQATGIAHLKELGITHVHLLPVFDYRSVDETKLDSPQFNWGYDPQNYNVPEGSYSTDPADPSARIREFKQMVQSLHQAGIRVIMDVVYNHTGLTEGSNFNLEVPGYYYRHTAEGKWSDAAACGNETASERAMMRKYIIESCEHWVKEYHIDGFRFDLMGIHDIETLNQLTDRLLKVEPSLIFYGEGWTAGASPLPDSLRALKANTARLKHFAAFSDDLRDGLKGSVFDEHATAFVNGGSGAEQSIRFGIVAATEHPQVDYSKVNYSKAPWAREPWQCINYVSCHDNHTLADKLKISGQGKFSGDQLLQMDKLANGIVLTSQGISFLHAGEEMMRTKKGVENSFNKPDSINAIDWSWKDKYADVYAHYRLLIGLRKAHPAFRMSSAEQIRANLKFVDSPSGVVAYSLDGKAAGDSWNNILVVANGTGETVNMTLPGGPWRVGYDGSLPGTQKKERQVSGKLMVGPKALVVLHTTD